MYNLSLNIALMNCRLFPSEGETGIRELQDMLLDPNIETAVCQGDIYATMIEYYVSNNNYKSALNLLQDMKSRLPKVREGYAFVEGSTLPRKH